MPRKILTTFQWSRLSKDQNGASRAWPTAPRPRPPLPVALLRPSPARAHMQRGSWQRERERRPPPRLPSIRPSFLPFCGAHSYLVVLPQNRSVTFSPSSSSAHPKPEHVTAAAAALLPLAHASVVIIMTGAAAAATAAEAGALLARSEWQLVLPDLPEMMISTHILRAVCPSARPRQLDFRHSAVWMTYERVREGSTDTQLGDSCEGRHSNVQTMRLTRIVPSP